MATKNSKKLRIGIIGAGGIAGAHMTYLQQMDDVEIVALADVNEAAMARHAKTYNVSQTYTDYHEMLAKANLDAVSVCTPNGLHAPCTIAALAAGAHVLVEKPLAMNAREGQQMLDAAAKHKKKLVIGFQWRFGANTEYLRKSVEEGTFGKIMYARCQALRRRGIPNWGVFGRKELQGGGPMIDIGVHILEVTHFVMGSPRPIAATGQTWTYLGNKKSNTISMWPNWDYKTYNVEDLAVGQIRFENGAVLSLESSFVSHIDKDVFGFSIMGEKGGANWDPPVIFKDEAGYMVNQTPSYLSPNGYGDHFQLKMRNFVDHVLYNKPTLAPAEHGQMVQKMLDGIYESAAKGKEVTIN